LGRDRRVRKLPACAVGRNYRRPFDTLDAHCVNATPARGFDGGCGPSNQYGTRFGRIRFSNSLGEDAVRTKHGPAPNARPQTPAGHRGPAVRDGGIRIYSRTPTIQRAGYTHILDSKTSNGPSFESALDRENSIRPKAQPFGRLWELDLFGQGYRKQTSRRQEPTVGRIGSHPSRTTGVSSLN